MSAASETVDAIPAAAVSTETRVGRGRGGCMEAHASGRPLHSRPMTPLLERYRDLLAAPGEAFQLTLGEGGTPLIHAPRLGAELGLASLHLKFEGTNPTGSFKDRGMVLAVNRALARAHGPSSAHRPATPRRRPPPTPPQPASVPCSPARRQGRARQARTGARRRRAAPRGRRQLRRGARGPRTGEEGLAWSTPSTRTASPGSRRSPSRSATSSVAPPTPWRSRSATPATSPPTGAASPPMPMPTASTRPRLLGFQAAGAAPIVRGAPSWPARRRWRPRSGSATRRRGPGPWRRVTSRAGDRGGHRRGDPRRQRCIVRPRGHLLRARHGGRRGRRGRLARDGRIGREELVVCILTGHGLKDPDMIQGEEGTLTPVAPEPPRSGGGARDLAAPVPAHHLISGRVEGRGP